MRLACSCWYGLLLLVSDHVFLQLLDRFIDGFRELFHGFRKGGGFDFAGNRQCAAGGHDIGCG